MSKRYSIQVNVPTCPKCASGLSHNRIDHEYTCRHCKTDYIVVGTGATDREIMCEEKNARD